MARLRRTPVALHDLSNVWLTIALDNPNAADRVVSRIYDAEERLADFPELGRVRPELLPDLRSWAVGDYVILYRIEPDAVVIVRILHGARDLGDLLGD
ncbi:type II toxin-antitoxin system RelE/ParE family toxin [Phenylobacterium sp.]|uniref:type II toxin-antitoxin system RelE/ParE family toxin n=1 Tax=Phenylobacterium sp. TaxID=1871053 RepID=UPI003BABBD20